MLGAPDTQIIAWRTRNRGPRMMVRRAGVKETDFVSVISQETRSIQRVPVLKARGGEADAIGVTVTLEDGTSFRALVSYEPEGTEMRVGELRTDERFAADYAE